MLLGTLAAGILRNAITGKGSKKYRSRFLMLPHLLINFEIKKRSK